jgi:hypothetical protein
LPIPQATWTTSAPKKQLVGDKYLVHRRVGTHLSEVVRSYYPSKRSPVQWTTWTASVPKEEPVGQKDVVRRMPWSDNPVVGRSYYLPRMSAVR